MPRREIPETHFARSGDVSIAYQVFGEGARDFVIVPGIISNIELAWESPDHAGYMHELAKHFRVIAFDKRGQGMSDPLEGSLSLEERMDDLRAVMDAAGSEKAVIMGVSEGGPMSILFATTYPDRVDHLVLCGTYAKGCWAEDYPFVPTLEERQSRVVDNWGRAAFFAVYSPGRLDDDDFIAEQIRYLRQSASPKMIRRLNASNARIDVRSILAEIRAPTLIVQQRHDKVARVENCQYLAAHIPGATYLELPGGDHIPWACDYIELVGTIRHFAEAAGPSESQNRKLATALFTDIENSTGQLAAMGDVAWRKTLDRHDAVAREVINRHQGRFVKSTGDGCLDVFDGPTRAIRCAKNMIEKLGEIGLPSAPASMPAR